MPMRNLILLGFILTCLNIFAQKSTVLIDKTILSEMMHNQDIQLVDVRTPKEFANGSLEGAINIDFWNPDFLNLIKSRFTKKKALVVFCAGGGRSAMACDKLSRQGFKVLFDLEGGYESYTE